MAIRIPGTNIKIGKSKKQPSKKEILDKAYKRVLASSTDPGEKVKWPTLAEGDPNWYDTNNENLRRATAAGLMREAERQTKNAPKYKLVFDHPDQDKFGEGGPRAFSSSEGLVNMPSDIAGYMSKPQYLSSVLAHEVAHNVDYVRNKPKVGHNKETFRPLEKAASRAAMLEPRYDPGDDVGIGGKNEYADEYMSLGPWKDQYFLSANQMDPTREVYPVDVKKLARAIINRRNITRGGVIPTGGYKNLAGPTRGFQI